MGSKTLLTALWLVGTIVAAMVAWQSLSFVTASTEGEVTAPTLSATDDARTSVTSDGSPSMPTTRPSTSATTRPPTETSTSGPAGSSSTSTTADPSPSGAPIEQTFDLIGGRVAISFSPSEVVVVWATPAPGYTVDSHREDGGVEVEFDDGTHESKIEAWWADGPRFETREDDDD